MHHNKSGLTVEVPEDGSFKFAIYAVIDIEYRYELSKIMPPWECENMLREAHDAAEKYLVKKFGR